MNIKQTKKDKIISDDPLIQWLLKAKELGRKNVNSLIGVAIALVVIVGGIVTFQQIKKHSLAKAASSFGDAIIAHQSNQTDKAIELFRAVADNHRSTPHAFQSAYMLGNILYGLGKYDEAISWYTEASKDKSNANFLAGQALEAIALCYEAKGDIPNTISYLEKALADNKAAYRHKGIKWKIALLTRNSDVDRTKSLCQELISDTLATEFHQKAENLLATIEFGSSS